MKRLRRPFGPKLHKTREGKIVQVLAHHGITLALDVGANIGQTGKALRRAGYRGRIVSFEPVPAAYRQLERAAAGDAMWIVAPRAALGRTAGRIEINVSEASDLSSALLPAPPLLEALPYGRTVESVSVDQITLADALGQWLRPEDRVFVKIDVQGTEDAVLDGARDRLAEIDIIQLEMSLFPLYRDEKTYEYYFARLAAAGFRPWLMFETNFSRNLSRQLQIDAVFVREGDG